MEINGDLLINDGLDKGQGSLTVNSDLIVFGNTVKFNDNAILLNDNATSSYDTGILFNRFNTDIASIIFSESNNAFVLGTISSDLGKTTLSVSSYIDLIMNRINSQSTENANLLGTEGSIISQGGMYITQDAIINGNSIFKNYTEMSAILSPSNPASGYIRFFIDDTDNQFKSLNSLGVLTTYNPLTTKGDLIVHNGTTEAKFPIGFTNQVLHVDPTTETGVAWKDLSTDTGIVDETVTRYFEVFNSGSTSYLGIYQDVIIDTNRVSNINFFEYTNQSILKIKFTGIYLIFVKISTQNSSGNTASSSNIRLVIDNNDDIYTEIPGTLSFLFNYNNTSGNTTCFCAFLLNVVANQKLKIQIKRNTGNLIVSTLPNGCNLGVIKFFIDGTNDNSLYYNGYSITNQIMSINSIYINFNDRIIQGAYNKILSSEIQFAEGGIYYIISNISIIKSAGNDISLSESFLEISDINGLNYSQVIGSLMYTFHLNANSSQSASTNCILSISAGQRIRLGTKIINGSNLNTISNGSSLVIAKFASTLNAQNTPKFLDLYSSISQTIDSVYTDLTLNTTRIIDDIYEYTSGQSSITLLESGRYIILAKISLDNTNTNQNNDCYSQIRALLDTGNGFSELAGSLANNYHEAQNLGKTTLQISLTLNATQNSQIKFQAIRTNSSGNLISLANTFNVCILKIDPLVEQVDSLLKFGTEYQYVESSVETIITSLVYVEKLRLTTNNIRSGIYRVSFSYITYPSNNNTPIDVRIQIDDINTIHFNTIVTSTNSRKAVTDFSHVQLTEGIHNIDLDFKATNASATIQNAKIEFWRVA